MAYHCLHPQQHIFAREKYLQSLATYHHVWQIVTTGNDFWNKKHKKRLATGLCPGQQGELTALPRPLSWI